MRTGLSVAALVVALDQLTKWLVLAVVMDPPRVIPVTPFFNLVLTWNRGVSFGMFGGGAVPPWALTALAAAIVIFLLVWLRRAEEGLTRIAVGLVIGGAIGNVIDRLYHGAVVDFLDVHLAGWHWPAFNVADSAITIGVILLLAESLLPRRASLDKPEKRERRRG